MSDGERDATARYRGTVHAAASVVADAIGAVEAAFRHLDPRALQRQQNALGPVYERVTVSLAGLRDAAPPERFAPLHEQLIEGIAALEGTLAAFAAGGGREERGRRVLGAMGGLARAQEALYPLRGLHPALGGLFAEPAARGDLAALDACLATNADVGIHRSGDGDPDARGEFHAYVPESWDGAAKLPLVVALHGGMGSGRGFLWTWLREARSRRFLLVAPTSRGSSWPVNGPDVDRAALLKTVDFACDRWNADRARILLTGLSDGATYALSTMLHGETPFTAVAAVAGVLHPSNVVDGGIPGAPGKRVYIAHGTQDWMFPIALARLGQQALRDAGADVTFHEIEDLAHAYPREENDRILTWFDPSLALPELAT